jgi:hypothetical protein
MSPVKRVGSSAAKMPGVDTTAPSTRTSLRASGRRREADALGLADVLAEVARPAVVVVRARGDAEALEGDIGEPQPRNAAGPRRTRASLAGDLRAVTVGPHRHARGREARRAARAGRAGLAHRAIARAAAEEEREGIDNIKSALGLFYQVAGVKGLTLNAQVENLWDTAFQDVPLVPSSRREWSAGATYVW